ncbi:MAG: tyrosine-type recombinase/integrase [Thermoleophilaceae bacterium]|nr:tyrosine-type recombinase/integrase [Thermoleophilaceae bacterium]
MLPRWQPRIPLHPCSRFSIEPRSKVSSDGEYQSQRHFRRHTHASDLSDPFNASAITKRADRAWREAGLKRITLHECRHTFASLMIAAGVNVKALSTYMGHANISITLDRYGHLMPGNEQQAAGLLDDYLSTSLRAV